jgi:hypothetical protein
MTLVSDIVNRIERRIAQLSGPGAQTFTQDILIEHITSAFNNTFDQHTWPAYMVWVATTFDGVTGAVTADLSATPVKDAQGRIVDTRPLADFADILGVYPGTISSPLPNAPVDVVPMLMQGSSPLYIIPYPELVDKVFRVIPFTSTGDVYVNYKSSPTNIDMDTNLHVDEELLVCAATFLYLADDATNPTATNVALGRLQSQEKSVAQRLAQRVPLTPFGSQPVDYWWSS